MMRRVIISLGLLVGSVAAALWFERQGGFVMVRVGDLTLQSSLFVAVGAVVVAWALAALASGLLRRLWNIPDQLRGGLGRRRTRRALNELLDGVIELAEGRYALAEKRLERSVESARLPLFNHLLAAVAAQRRGDWTRRDDLLAAADATEPRARVAVGLVQAQLQVDAAQWEQALATLGWLRREAPRNHRALLLLVRTLGALDDEAGLEDALPDLRREGVLPDTELLAIEARVLQRRFEALGPQTGADALARVWKSLPRPLQRSPDLRACYARALMHADCPATAERQLRRWLSERWADALVDVYGELELDPPQRTCNQLGEWLRERSEDPTLLFAAARQCLRASLWGQARSYLEAAAARSADPRIQQYLAELYERLDEPDRARRAYRAALGLEPRALSLPAPDAPAAAEARRA